ncbi:MAG: LysM peptidoglycan-binding domain-containing protein [Oscillospiraceae bacterium]|jgi:LysM repeat protein|nr:LysM peptidoglycan-binding domain-containing protein [Oscillospiraceae bacterium]
MSDQYSLNNPESIQPAGADAQSVQANAASLCGPGASAYVIGRGETLYGIAQRYQTTVDAILKANPGLNPQLYYEGDTICIPKSGCAGEVYTIQSGDTFYAIALKHGVTVTALLEANPGVNPEKLVVGQTVCIPKGAAPAPACAGSVYTIKRGDTFFAIAQANKVTLAELTAANPGVNPEKLYVGQSVCVPKAAPTPPPTPPACDGTLYTVRRGDTFYAIAQWHKVALSELIAANPSVTPETLFAGMVICVPKPGVKPPDCEGTRYTIQRGDTFYMIAQKNGVAVADLLSANTGVNPEKLYVGQVVCVPDNKPVPPPVPACDGDVYAIVKGDTFYEIARKNGVTIAELLAANPGVNPEKLYVGQMVCVPAKAGPAPACEGTRYIVVKGDTLFEIARKTGVGLVALLQANVGVNPEKLEPGQVLCIPAAAAQAEIPREIGEPYVMEKTEGASQLGAVTPAAAEPEPAADNTVVHSTELKPEPAAAPAIGDAPSSEPSAAPRLEAKPTARPEPAEPAVPAAPVIPPAPVVPAAPAIPPAPVVPPATSTIPSQQTIQPPQAIPPVPAPASASIEEAAKTEAQPAHAELTPPDALVGTVKAAEAPEQVKASAEPVPAPEAEPVNNEARPNSEAQPIAATQPCNGVRYTIHKGDTFFDIAKWNNVELVALLAANPGVNPERLEVGQSICVPLPPAGGNVPACNGALYTIQKGDTLFDIARRNSVPINDLLVANPGVVPEKLEPGQQVCIPGGGGVSPFCANGTPYSIRKGDTLYAIAIQFGIPLVDVLEANPGVNPERLVEGDLVCVPDKGVSPAPFCPKGTPYIITQGDTFYSIALRYGVALADLLSANPMVNPQALEPGDVVCIPVINAKPFCETGIIHVVEKGDTLYTLALKFGAPLSDLMASNPSVVPEKLEIGSRLCVPNYAGPVFCKDGVPYVIQKGDTLYSLAQRFGVTLEEILAVNPGLTPEKLQPDDVVCVPKHGSVAPPPVTPPTPPSVCPGSTAHVIQKGDTFYTLALWYGVTIEAIKALNPSVDPNNLTIGQTVCVPGTQPTTPTAPCKPTVHCLQCGETLFSVAKKYGVTLADLFAANPGLHPDCLMLNARIAIPCPTPEPVDPVEPILPVCPSGKTYTVLKGDSFYLIARRFGLDLADLLAANPGTAPDKLLVGQVICLPIAKAVCAEGHTIHYVTTGQTFYDLLVIYNLSYSALAAANPGVDLTALTEGQTLCVPPQGSRGSCADSGLEPYLMLKGDTLASIAAMYHVATAAILAANPTLTPADFVTGRIICLPKGASLG